MGLSEEEKKKMVESFASLARDIISEEKSNRWIGGLIGTSGSTVRRYTLGANIPDSFYEQHDSIMDTMRSALEKEIAFKKSTLIDLFHHRYLWIAPLIFALLTAIVVLIYENFSSSPQSEISTIISWYSLVGYTLNFTLVGVLIYLYYNSRKTPTNSKKNQFKYSVYIFHKAWTYTLFSWLLLYFIRMSWHWTIYFSLEQDLGLLDTHVEDHYFIGGLLFIFITKIINAYNTLFLYFCFLLLDISKPFRLNNPRFIPRFRNFIILLTTFLILSLIDGVYSFGSGFDSSLSVLFSCFMAASFLLLVSKLDSPYFKKTKKSSMSMGTILFYAACMPVFSIISKESPIAISLCVIVIFAIGKLVFGNFLNDKLVPLNNDMNKNHKNEIESYFHELYKNDQTYY